MRGSDFRIDERELVDAVYTGRMHPMTEVSFDAGRTWIMAGGPAQRLHAKMFGQDGLGVVVPIGVEPWCLGAGYFALAWPFFGGVMGPVLALTAGMSPEMTLGARFLFVLGGFVFGPTPIALVALKALKKSRSDPTYSGRGRAIFALVVAGLLALPCLAGLVLMPFAK